MGSSPLETHASTHAIVEVRKGMGSQSMVICIGKYPRGKSRQQVL